ncbi:uncharacterized protein RB166_019846 isoform 1-T2 [Leptodactylus fuscus]|uniref:uncharacterized protein LOC142184442 n=1 Tax=Leptodactylus fuscus TaxID=238119 RepID=UPI003F4F23A5
MEPMETQLPVASSITKPDLESSIKEGKSVIITIPVDDECKSPDVYVIPDTTPTKQKPEPVPDPMPHIKMSSRAVYMVSDTTIKQETKPELTPLTPRKTSSQGFYTTTDKTTTIKQETKPEMNPLPLTKLSSQGPESLKPTIIVNIDDDDDEDEHCGNKQLAHNGDENSADWIIQDVITPVESKSTQNQTGPVSVWYVKSVKVNNQNSPTGENKSSYVIEENLGAAEKKPVIKVEPHDPVIKVQGSSPPQQTSHKASGFQENKVIQNKPASAGSKFGAHHPDEIAINDDLIEELEEKIQVCPECSMCFTSVSDLETHMNSHKEGSSWICSECGKSYYTKSSLDRHHLTHLREKPLKCPECGKGFAKQNNFEMHLRLHAGEVLFPCTECEKLFNSKASCDRHIRAHKMERPHVCPQCGKGFLYNGCLIRHIRVHTGERPFPCPECGRCFRQTSALNRHVKTHSGEKPFDCSDCGKCFTHQSDLNRHKETHRRGQPFVQCAPTNESSLATYIIL